MAGNGSCRTKPSAKTCAVFAVTAGKGARSAETEQSATKSFVHLGVSSCARTEFEEASECDSGASRGHETS